MSELPRKTLSDLGLLILRAGTAGMLIYGHGWGKLMNFSSRAETFADPLGIGSTFSLALAVFGEVFCAAALLLGLFTRLAAIPVLITMLVAAFLVNTGENFAAKELALLYAVPALALMLTGPGGLSLDAWRKRR